MAFASSLIEVIYRTIQDRKAELDRISLVEFDDEEYKELLHWGREIVQEYHRWLAGKQAKARIIFLALACEYVRRNKYIDDNKFWDDFEEELGIDKRYYELISEEFFWKTFQEEHIDRKWSSGNVRRLFVESLILEVRASEASRQKLLDFFLWYYRNCSTGEVTTELIRSYESESGRQLSLAQKALPALNKDCQVLARIITYAIEQNLNLASADFDTYNREVMIALGPQYDLGSIQLIRSKKKLHELIIDLENHCTPLQFLSALERAPKAMVQMPNGDRVPSLTALEWWKTRNLPYGVYLLDGVKYRILPIRWLSLESIAQWPHEKVIALQRSGYIAYKKRTRFHGQIGKRPIEGRLCILQNERCYIWADAISHGEPLVIDGKPYREAVGVNWKVSLQLGYGERLQPVIEIVCDSLKVYFPEKPRSRISIRTSQGYEQTEFLTLDGVGNFSRAITLPLDNFAGQVEIWLYLDDELLYSKTVSPEHAYLFSCQTHECIPAGTKREWGENRYYLFTTSVTDIMPQGIDLELLDVEFGPYRVYQVTWEQRDHPFQLEVGSLSWNFRQQRYFFIQMKPPLPEEPIQLEHHQIHRFSQSTLSVMSNMNLLNSAIMCQVLFASELICEEEVRFCLQQFDNNRYLFTPTFLQKLNALTVGLKRYGRYNLLFTEEGKLLESSIIALMPMLSVASPQLEQLLQENEALHIEITSADLDVWDPSLNRVSATATVKIRSTLSIRQITRGIAYVMPGTITALIVFPAIGETAQIKVHPKLFGFRLYQNRKGSGDYVQIDILNFYALEMAALYIFTGENFEVTLYVEDALVWSGQADGYGDITVQGLGFLQWYCQREQTVVSVVSGGQKSTFVIRWNPQIHEISVEKDRVHLGINGPQGTGIILRVVDVNNLIRSQQFVDCIGTRFETILNLPSIEPGWGQCYLMPVYLLANDTKLPSVTQWRIALNNAIEIPIDWLRAGIGISSVELLQTFHVESK